MAKGIDWARVHTRQLSIAAERASWEAERASRRRGKKTTRSRPAAHALRMRELLDRKNQISTPIEA